MVDTTQYPYRSIVRIVDSIAGVFYQASGVLISPDEVLTAAHVVWDSAKGVAANVTVTPGYNAGTAPFGSISGTVTHYNPISDANDTISDSQIPNDFAVIHLSTPVAVGTMKLGADFTSGVATVSGYPGTANGAQVDQTEGFSLYRSGELTGTSIGAGSSGGPVWTTDSAGTPTIVGLVSASDSSGKGYFPDITSADRTTILSWMAQDDGYSPTASTTDLTTGVTGTVSLAAAASGSPSYLQWQYIWSSADGVSMSTTAPNSFLHGGAGTDALQVASGQNVLDGGTGSNFLIGGTGTGTDTFFTDARDPAVVWSTLQNFHTGDMATLWGFTPGVSSYYWEASPAGAPGATGATLRADIVGGTGRTGNGIDASITFAGLSVAQAKQLQASTGSNYLFFYNPGV